MPLTTQPTKVDGSIGRVKSDATPATDLNTQVPAAEWEQIKDVLIDVCDEVGNHAGTVGSLNERVDDLEDTSATIALTVTAVSGNVAITGRGIYRVDTSAERNLQLPNPATVTAHWPIVVIDESGTSKNFPIHLVRNGSEQIDGIAATADLAANHGRWIVVSPDGVNWRVLPMLRGSASAPLAVGRAASTGTSQEVSRADHQHDGGQVAIANETGNFSLTAAHEYVRITSAGAVTITLPSPASVGARKWSMLLSKDDAGDVTLDRAGTETIQGVAADYVLSGPWSQWQLICDGTDWWLF